MNIIEKFDLQNGIVWLSKSNWLTVKGIGGDCHIIAIHPAMPMTFGTRVIRKPVGITDGGDFELLVGNEVAIGIKPPN